MKKLLVGIFAVAMLFAFSAPAMAADWDFYGSARMGTWSQWTDYGADIDDLRNTVWALQGNSRVGAKVKANDNGIGGRFEYGSGPNLRLLYGTWDFGGGQILIGQYYTPTTHFISNQTWDGDLDLIGYGMPYGGRQPQIAFKTGGFKLAFITPASSIPSGYFPTGEGTSAGIEATLPKMETSYNFKTDMFFIRPYLGYNTYIIAQSDSRDRTMSSWLGGFTFGVTPGAFYFKGGAFYAYNPSEYGISMASGLATSFDAATSELSDINSWGFQALAGFKVNDGLTFEGGIGGTFYTEDKDNQDFVDDWDEADVEDWGAYFNASITLAPGFFVVPEIGWLKSEWDGETNDLDGFYFGAKWQINF